MAWVLVGYVVGAAAMFISYGQTATDGYLLFGRTILWPAYLFKMAVKMFNVTFRDLFGTDG